MTNKDKKHLDFDLDFLESVETVAPDPAIKKKSEGSLVENKTTHHPEHKQNKPKSNNCLTIVIVVAVIIFFIWILSDDSGTSSTSAPSSCDTVKLSSLKPPDSEKTQLDTLESAINSTVVNQYSQFSVDQYNAKINQYNALRDSYNAKIDAYNNYLNSNCKQ